MKKIKFYSLISIFLLVFILTACSSKKEIDNDEIEPIGEDEVVSKDEVLVTSTKDLLNKDESLYCESFEISEETEVKTSYYFDNENQRMRSDSEIYDKVESLNYNSSYILMDDWVYMWNDLMIMDGMKFYIEEDEAEADTLDLEQELEFNCQSWQVDDSIFDLPGDINFSDMTDFINQLKDFEFPEMD